MIVSTIIGDDDLTLSEVKSHLNVTFSDDDDYIKALISTSLNAVENYCRSMFLERNNKENIGTFETNLIPKKMVTNLTNKPNDDLVTVNYIKDTVAVSFDVPILDLYTFEKTNYYYGSGFITINLIEDIEIDQDTDISISWHVGMNKMDDALKHARLLLIGNFYENRESVLTGVSLAELPNGTKYLLEPYLIPQLG